MFYWYNSLTGQLHDWQSCLILKSYFACPTVLLRQKFVYLHVTLLFVQQRSQLFTYLLIELYGLICMVVGVDARDVFLGGGLPSKGGFPKNIRSTFLCEN